MLLPILADFSLSVKRKLSNPFSSLPGGAGLLPQEAGTAERKGKQDGLFRPSCFV